MQQIIAISEIETRARALGIGLGELAADAGLHRSTAYRAARGESDVRTSTANKLSSALLAREQATLRRLIDLHGIPAQEAAQ